jgi:hypothetical protein
MENSVSRAVCQVVFPGVIPHQHGSSHPPLSAYRLRSFANALSDSNVETGVQVGEIIGRGVLVDMGITVFDGVVRGINTEVVVVSIVALAVCVLIIPSVFRLVGSGILSFCIPESEHPSSSTNSDKTSILMKLDALACNIMVSSYLEPRGPM